MILFFFWIAWIWVLIIILSDVFRRDMSGWLKAAWIVFLIFLPFLGVLVYLIAQGQHMAERKAADVKASQAAFDDYVRDVAAKEGPSDQIAKAKQLLDSGAIDASEFERLKAKALG
jgi:hypothetical protein